MTAVILGIAMGIVLIFGLVVVLDAAAGVDPPAEPLEVSVEVDASRDALFYPPVWENGRERIAAAPAPIYNRPLEVQLVPDNEILAAPREVRGVNNEV